jgi:hypothetical protein
LDALLQFRRFTMNRLRVFTFLGTTTASCAVLSSTTSHAQDNPSTAPIRPPSSSAPPLSGAPRFPASPDGVLSALPPPNLRLSIACADNGLVTPETGLRVTVDNGEPLSAGTTDYGLATALTPHGHEIAISVPTDVAYAVPPGLHRLRLEAPGCAPTERDVEVPGFFPLALEGALPTNPELRGPVDLPDGIGLLLGGFDLSFPKSLTSGATSNLATTPGSFTLDGSSAAGVSVSTALGKRYFTARIDLGFGVSSYSGQVTPPAAAGLMSIPAGPVAFSGNAFVTTFAFRAGARLPFHYAALSAGSGIGGSLWLMNANFSQSPGIDTSNLQGMTPFWDVPLWAALEVKPLCDWGAELTASYNIDPSDSGGTTVMLGAALLWQPASACSREPYLKAVQP